MCAKLALTQASRCSTRNSKSFHEQCRLSSIHSDVQRSFGTGFSRFAHSTVAAIQLLQTQPERLSGHLLKKGALEPTNSSPRLV